MADADAQLVNHVPDELSVQVRASRDADPAQLYEAVRGALNGFVEHLPGTPEDVDEHLADDLRPRHLARGQESELLLPLGRPGQPWLLWPSASGSSTAAAADTLWHIYYRLGAERASFNVQDTDSRHAREQRVRELTNLLNWGGGPSGSGWSITGGSANWLTSGLPFSCGSPAAVPVAHRGTVRGCDIVFGQPAQAELSATATASARRAKVIVAILDTCPAHIDDHDNPVLRDLLQTLNIQRPLDNGYFNAPPWQALQPWWQEHMPDEPRPEFAMPDHGLFVAGLVHNIAPDVELHLFQVLDDYGIGDQLALEHVLRSLPDRLLRNDPDARLIVNLSLGSAVPVPRQRYWRRWLPQSHRHANRPWPDDTENRLLDAAHQTLRNTVDWLHSRGVLVVAAAGNDGLRQHNGGERPAPRYPAYYEPVFAVASAVGGGQPASYSNRGDVQPYGNGITTFGGNVDLPRHEDQPPITARDGSIVGLASSPVLAGGERNQTGWVHWAGTSFSTAIVSGLAARLWQQDGSQTPKSLTERIRRCATNIPGTRGRDPDGPLDAPYLEAYQRVS